MVRKQTVNAILVKRLGIRRAINVEIFIMCWSVFRQTNDRDPDSLDELADVIEKDRATLFRWQSDFREALDNRWSTPGEFLDAHKVGGLITPKQVGKLHFGGA